MAVKGKSRSGAAPGAPKPKIEPRKTPLSKRPGFRRAMAVGGALLILFIVLSVWGRVSRANDLRTYDRALTAALRPFQKHAETGSPTNLAEGVRQIGAGELTPKRIDELAEQWQTDFSSASDAVGRLDPPDELELANAMYVDALEDYGALARMAAAIADERRLAARATGRAEDAAKAQVSAWQSMLQEGLSRADERRTAALAEINELKADWGVGAAAA